MDALKQPLVMPRVMQGASEDVGVCVCVFLLHTPVYMQIGVCTGLDLFSVSSVGAAVL